jgi:hypothetical protein
MNSNSIPWRIPMCSHGSSFPFAPLSSTMWKHNPLNRIGQIPWSNVAQLWWHEGSPPFPQAKHLQPFNLGPIKIPKLNGLESYTFRWSFFEGHNNLVKLGLFILSKTSNCFRVKRIVVGGSSSFSWSSWLSQSFCSLESSCSSL